MSQKTNKKTVRRNRCKICKIKIKDHGNCKSCNKSLVIVNEMLINDLKVVPKEHELYELYFGAIYAALEEKRNVLMEMANDKVSFLSLAIIEAAETKDGNRKLRNYVQHMDYEKIVAVHFYDEHNRLPTKDELQTVLDSLNSKIEGDSK